MRAAVDSTVILERGAVEDTYNLIWHGIRQLVRVLAGVEGEEAERWAEGKGLGRGGKPGGFSDGADRGWEAGFGTGAGGSVGTGGGQW